MISDEKIVQLSRELDGLLADLVVKYNVAPLTLAAIVNARLMHAVSVHGNVEDYHKLLRSIVGMEAERLPPNYSRH